MSPRSPTNLLRPSFERTYLFVAIGLLVLYVFPYIWLGEDAYLTIHDNLDSDFLYLHLLNITGTAFDFKLNTVIPNVMNGGEFPGIPRSAFRTGLNLEVLSFWLLPPYIAQVVNFAVVHGIGFVGMYLLLKKHVLPEPNWAFTRVAIAFMFALVPCYTVHGASVSGQPLLLFAFLNLSTRRAQWTDWLIIGLFPFYSFFVWAGLFICIALGIIGLFPSERKTTAPLTKRINRPYMGGLLLLGGLYVLSEWQMIYSFLGKTYVSHRTEYNYAQLMPITIKESLRKSYHLFVQTQYHTGAFITVWIFLVATFASLRAYRQQNPLLLWRMITLLGIGVIICLISGFYRFPAVWLGQGNILQQFQFDRFYFLLPLLWFYLFAIALRTVEPNGWQNRLFLAGQLVVMIVANTEFTVNAGKLAGVNKNEKLPSYRAFYSPQLFGHIRDYIGRPQASYRVVNIGIHPAIALYNGFYTLDGYQNNYLLAYKHAFRNVITNELAKAPAIQNYYDYYGCRCYTYSAELGMSPESSLCGKEANRTIQQLSLNTSALRALGGEYVMSAVQIRNAAANQLRLEKIFDDPESYWRVWLYRIERE